MQHYRHKSRNHMHSDFTKFGLTNVVKQLLECKFPSRKFLLAIEASSPINLFIVSDSLRWLSTVEKRYMGIGYYPIYFVLGCCMLLGSRTPRKAIGEKNRHSEILALSHSAMATITTCQSSRNWYPQNEIANLRSELKWVKEMGIWIMCVNFYQMQNMLILEFKILMLFPRVFTCLVFKWEFCFSYPRTVKVWNI